MKNRLIQLWMVLFVFCLTGTTAFAGFLSIDYGKNNEIIIAVDPQIHLDYGLAYPLTFELAYIGATETLHAYKKYAKADPWTQIAEKTTDDFFNAIEVVRLDNQNHLAYVSVGFSGVSDSIFLQITDASKSSLAIRYQKICKYYDNRDAAVAGSADDMAGWSRSKFEKALHILRSYRIWVSCGINTDGCDSKAYRFIQAQLDSGYVEASAHSRTHPSAKPYKDYEYEITGCKEDIIKNLDLPPLFKSGGREYVYTWIAPNGYIDSVIDSVVGRNKFLVNRLYYNQFDGFPDWNMATGMYHPIGVTRAFDPPKSRLGWGIGSDDSTDLNNGFDEALAKGSVYYVMCHPNVVEWEKAYPWSHLNHISNRKNIWYVSLGHLYLYHLIQENSMVVSVAKSNHTRPVDFQLGQNYPNPFNPETTIPFDLKKTERIKLSIYNGLGQLIEVVLDEKLQPGSYAIRWRAASQPSGIYFYQIQTESRMDSRKMILLR